jgi:hypothetical protein
VIAVTEFSLIPDGFSMDQIVSAVEDCCSQRYARQVAHPDWFKREQCEWK